MPGVVHPVHFLRAAPFHVESGSILFYDIVDSSALSRSSVLSCIAEAEGEASLPDSVTVFEFRKWLAAVTDSKSEFQAKSFSFMCTVIKVADAVDDKQIDAFVRFAATTLLKNAHPSSSEEIKRDTLEGLSVMSDHLQRRLFAKALAHPSNQDVLLNFLPAHLHAIVLSSKITSEAMLRYRLGCTWSAGLEALASLPAAPPSVLSLLVDARKKEEGLSFFCRESGEEQRMTSQLAAALRHHAGLTSLQVQSPSTISISTAHQLLSPIAQLTSLHSLRLDQFTPFSAADFSNLKQMLTALPLLHTLSLHLSIVAASSSSSGVKRKSSEQQAAPPQGCLADLLSPTTALTSLALSVSKKCHHDPAPRTLFAVSTPPKLPVLRDLTALLEDVTLTAQFLHLLAAPLTSIKIADPATLEHTPHLLSADVPAVQHLFQSLASFPHLRHLTAALPTDEHAHIRSAVFNAVTAALPPLLSAFSQLQACTLVVEPAVAHRLLPQLADAAPELTQLHLGVWRSDDDYNTNHDRSRTFAPAWQEMFSSLCQWQLQHVHLDFHHGYGPPGHGLAALQPLTQLTALLVPGWTCLRSPADWHALAGMTRLQQLHLKQTGDTVAPPHPITSLQALTSLTAVKQRRCAPVQALTPAVAAHLPPPSLPELRELTVKLYDPFDAAPLLTAYAAALPVLTTLKVYLFPSASSHESDSDYDSQDESAHPYGKHLLRVSDVCRSLEAAAADAGVELQVDQYEIERFL